MKTTKAEFDHMLPKKPFLFDPRKLDEIVKSSVGKSTEEAFNHITDLLDREYPGHICKERKWIFNNAGGAMGQLCILHASLREYIIIFGTCIGTEGHSGRYSSEVYDYMIQGEMQCEYEGIFKPEIHTPGNPPAYLGSKVVKHYRVKDEAWMLEYTRGWIAKMFPFGLCDSIFSTLDIRTICRIIAQYIKLAFRELFTK